MTPKSYDAIVIGAGVNGLVTAGYLGRAGKRVLVLERRGVAGDAAAGADFATGFRADLMTPGWMDPIIRKELGLGGGELGSGGTVFSPAPGGGGLLLSPDLTASAGSIRQFSQKDSERWGAFSTRMHRLAGFLLELYRVAPPRPTSTSWSDLWTLLGLGRRLKALGKTDMVELLRVLPMSAAELLNDWFESDLLKGTVGAAGVTNLCQGVRASGTGFVLLHHHVGLPPSVFRATGTGGTRLTDALLTLVRGHGVEVRTGARVARIAVANGRTSGVILETGEQITATAVASSADPRETLLGLVDAAQLNPEFTHAVRHIRYRGVTAQVNLALGELPRFAAMEGDAHLRGVISLAPSLDYLEKAYDDAKYGRTSARPWLSVTIPSLADPSLAPAGKHVMTVAVQYTPYRLREGDWSGSRADALADRVVAALNEYAPNLGGAVLGRQVITPLAMEQTYSLPEGNLDHGELMLDQVLFMRPVPACGRYRTPVQGLFLCGSGSHPGGRMMGSPARLAVREILADS